MRAMTVVLVAAAALALACAPPADRTVRLARLAAERRSLDTTLDDLEARMAASQARVRFWQELRERHESVSAVACASQEQHAIEMASHGVPPASSLHRARVAAAIGPERPSRAPATTSPGGARSVPAAASGN